MITSQVKDISLYQVSAGRSYPLGATFDGQGTNFALFSANATKVELCLFDANGRDEKQRITLPEFTDNVWHGYIEHLPVGTLYGYRVHGPFAPEQGHRFNAHKLLLDPYAKQIHGKFTHSNTHYGYDLNSEHHDLSVDQQDNANYLPKCVVTPNLTGYNSHPQVRRRNTLIYEMHVKGFTQQHPNVPVELRGTFAGLAQDSMCQYLLSLGITSIELMPVQSFINEPFIQKKGLANYWGYNSLSFFIPEPTYCHSNDPQEFRECVEKYHQLGIEVILDVVYNHTAEGDHLGPTLSFKGIDNASYYRLNPDDKRFYLNHSGCGNSLNLDHPRVLQLVTDSLRYWVEIMGVDGFRFDLAPILGRTEEGFNNQSHFFTALRQDPVLSRIKLIAEPWDIGKDGYQLGNFPNSWMEWNDKFRDTCRRFWRGDDGMAGDFARRLHGSSDLFESPSRRPSASINFITSHDGYTLHDLVSYEQKHNLANGENNQDGHNNNYSINFGYEGETDNKIINRLRLRQKRNLLTTLFIAQGTPMLLAGDEMSNSQQGNNNAYCQDNETSWLNWQNSAPDSAELAFVKQLISLRKLHPLLNRTHYQHGLEHCNKTGLADISWLNCLGELMQESDWHDKKIRCFSMLLAQTRSIESLDPAVKTTLTNNSSSIKEGVSAVSNDDALLVIFNAHPCEINYQLPSNLLSPANKIKSINLNDHWQELINTADTEEGITMQKSKHENSNDLTKRISRSTVRIAAHSCIVLAYKH